MTAAAAGHGGAAVQGDAAGSGAQAARWRGWRRPALWPRSLASRTALVVLAGLMAVQAGGLAIHTADQRLVRRGEMARGLGLHLLRFYRVVERTPPERQAEVVHDLAEELRRATLDPGPQSGDLPPASPGFTHAIQVDMPTAPLTAAEYPRDIRVYGGPWMHEVGLSLELPDGRWLNLGVAMRRAPDRQSPDFLEAFLAMTAAAAALILWAVRRLTAPVRTLAAAAERLGLDVNAPPLPEDGPSEVAKAAAAFNTMAARIRSFVDNRTFLLTAIGHDLRTPITRLKLRSEFIDDDELRGKFLHDLDELEAMVSSTLAFGRDALDREPMAAIDLGALVRTVLDEAGDAHPEAADRLGWTGPRNLVVHASPIALKRAFANLVGNAVAYAGGAQVSARAPEDGVVTVLVEDDGPGVPPALLERVFEPFHRGEPSRSRETGGTGLGLSITRNIVRAHGGDVVLRNRDGGGLRAVVTLRA